LSSGQTALSLQNLSSTIVSLQSAQGWEAQVAHSTDIEWKQTYIKVIPAMLCHALLALNKLNCVQEQAQLHKCTAKLALLES